MISNNVMELNDYGDMVFYRVACACGDRDCGCDIILEHVKHINDITITFYKDLYLDTYYSSNNYIVRLLNRLQLSLKILLSGHVKIQGEFLIQSEKHIDSFITALQEGKEKIKKNKGDQKCSSKNI